MYPPVRPRALSLRLPSHWVAAAFLGAVLIAGSTAPAHAATFYVNNAAGANCSNTGAGTQAQPYCTITAALNAQGIAGNTIIVMPGVYREQVSIPASGTSASRLIVQASGPGVIIDGSDDFSTAAQWTLVSGNVWLASAVNWDPIQVFLDGTRADSSVVAPASLPARTFRWVSGTGLYLNAGGGNPATHQAAVGRRKYGFTLPARSYVTIDGFTITRTEDRGINGSATCNNITLSHNTISYTNKMGIQFVGGTGHLVSANIVHDCNDHGIALISGATGCTIEDNESYNNARHYERAANGIYLFGCPANTIRRNRTHNNEDTGIHIQSGSNNCIQYQNRSYNNGDHGYDHLQSTGTIHNSDLAYGNHMDGFSIEGSATGTQLHNCIATDNGLTTNEFDLWVDLASTTGFVSDYNIFWNSNAAVPPVKYIDTQYTTVSAYSTFSGKDGHTLQSNPLFVSPAAGNFHIATGSPAIDNANSSSPNWPSTDADGQSRFDVKGVNNTGNGSIKYADRGAYENRGSTNNAAPNGTINTPTANVTIIAGQTVNFTGTGTDSDNNLPLTFAWNFGGGAPNSTVEDPGNVVFTTAGTYTVSFTVTDALGLPDPTPATRTITVTANAAPNGTITAPTGPVTITVGQSVNFTSTGTDPNNNTPLTYAWDFGGGATNSTLQNPGAMVFGTAGTYTVTLTVADALGASDPTPDTRVITVNSAPNQAPNGTIDTPTVNTTITAGQSVSFTGTGSDPDNNTPLTFAWNFGGGATNSTVEDPGAVTFATAGTYTVTFTVTDAKGLADPTPATRTITVNPVAANQAPNGIISTPAGNVTITAGQSVTFNGSGTDPDNNLPLTYAWNFGGGATNSTAQNPGAVTFATAGTYTVTFTVKDALNLADPTPDTRTITVNPVAGNQAPNGTISAPAGNVTITAGQSVTFNGSGTDPDNNLPLTYAWNFGGGAANSTAQNPGAVAFATAGTYTVTFTVKDALSLADPTPDTRTITVNPAGGGGCTNLVTNSSFETDLTGWKGGGSAVLSRVAGGSVGGFSCLVSGPASTSSFDIEDSPRSVSSPVAGTQYNFSASVRSDASVGKAYIRIIEYVNGVKVAQLDSPQATLSTSWQKLQVSYVATASGSNLYFTVKDSPVAASEAFNVDDMTACSGSSAPPNQAPNGTITAPAGNVTITAGQSVSFSGSGTDPDNNTPLTYAWNFGGGATNSTLQNPGAVTFATAGTYTVTFTVTDALNLADATPDTRTITVNPVAGNQAPNGTISAPAGNVTITAGQSVTFNGSGTDPDNNLPLTYVWNFGGGATNSTAQNPGAVTFATAGTYTVTFTVKDALSLADPTPDTRTITVNPVAGNQAPNGTISAPAGNVTITAGQSVTFNGSGTDPDNNLPLTYAWNFGGGAASSTLQNPGAVTFATAGTYTVTFTVKDALSLADPTPDTRTITVNPAGGGGCTNLVTNSSFETDLTGWKGGGSAVLSRVAGGSVGGFSCLVSGPASTSSFNIEDSPRSVSSPVAGTTYNFSASVRSDASVGKAYIRIIEYVNGVKVAQLDSPQATLSTSWQRLQVSYTATASGSNLYFTVKDSPVAVSETFNVDDMLACAGASPATIIAEDYGVASAAPEFIAPTVKPNPVGRQATLTFSTSRPGLLQVELYDVSGRRVRSLISDANAAAGIHALPLDGARLGSGVFFYRIRSVDGSSQGRFLIMN